MGIHGVVLGRLLKSASPRARASRMKRFAELMRIRPGTRIIDLGGSTGIWRFVDVPLDITIFNIDAQTVDDRIYPGHRFTLVQGDATDAAGFPDNSFDLVFSNSCIEHVGPAQKQAAFAREVRRLAPSYYVQTPSIAFPVEAHTGLPFWWYYPEAVRERLIQGWRKRRPDYGEFVAGTRVIRHREFQRYFPDAQIDVERVFGFSKSYTAWRLGSGPD